MKLFYLSQPLLTGSTVALPEDLQHRLYRVMRMEKGTAVHFFNGTGDAVTAEIDDNKCRTARILAALPPKPVLPTRILALGLPKREAWESALRQATELGATSIVPLKTRFSQVNKLNSERDHRHLVEAAEQSERYTLPTLLPVTTLEDFLTDLTTSCLWAYERMLSEASSTTTAPPTSVLVGPEGGFAPEEVALLNHHKLIRPFSLGPTILRTDTAVVASLTHLAYQS